MNMKLNHEPDEEREMRQCGDALKISVFHFLDLSMYINTAEGCIWAKSWAPDEEWEISRQGGDALKVRLRKWASCVRVLSEPSREQQFDNSNPSSNKKYMLQNLKIHVTNLRNSCIIIREICTQDSNNIWEIHLARSYSGEVRESAIRAGSWSTIW